MPKKGQKKWYFGKKKRHTVKARVVVAKKSRRIICTSFSNGKRHDFRLFKESGVHIRLGIPVATDTGYQGITKIHAHSIRPRKRTKKHPLSREDKRRNRKISRERVLNEHIIGLIKRFKIVADKYRSCRKRFTLRFNMICSICNFENNA